KIIALAKAVVSAVTPASPPKVPWATGRQGQPGAQSDVVRDVAERLLLGEHQCRALGRHLARGQDEIDAMRRRSRREIFGPERSRASAPNASASPVAAMKSPNKELSRAMLKSPQTTARGPASFTTRASTANSARCSG